MSQYHDGQVVSPIYAIDQTITIDGVTNSVENFVCVGTLRQIGSQYVYSAPAEILGNKAFGIAPQIKEDPPAEPPSLPLTLIDRLGVGVLDQPPYKK